MAKLKIKTGDTSLYFEEGNVSFTMTNVSGNIQIQGEMYTHKYFADIVEIESHRYILKGIEVVQEKFGSDDFFILYSFTAEDCVIKKGLTNLSDKLIAKIEDSEFKETDAKLWEGEDE